MKHSLLVVFPILITLLIGCDPQRKGKCEWYFVPFPEGNNVVKDGWVSVCVANPELGKQKCYFTAKPNFLEKMNGVPFKYNTLQFTNTFPKKITSVKTFR